MVDNLVAANGKSRLGLLLIVVIVEMAKPAFTSNAVLQ